MKKKIIQVKFLFSHSQQSLTLKYDALLFDLIVKYQRDYSMNNKEKRLYKIQAQVFKALAHPIRLAVVNFLKDGEQCVCDIIDYVDSERSNVSRHLAVLKQAGVVSDRKEGLQVYYRLNMPCAISFFSCVKEIVQSRIEEQALLLR